jgi:hypothetical protein
MIAYHQDWQSCQTVNGFALLVSQEEKRGERKKEEREA